MTTLPQTTSVRLPQSPAAGPASPGPLGIIAVPGSQMTGADVWRVIRANLWLIILMLVVSAAAGYGANWWLAKTMPSYTARGLVQVPQVVQTGVAGSEVRELANDRIMAEQRSQASIMLTERLFSEALQRESDLRKTDWFKSFSKLDAKGNIDVDTPGAKRSLRKNFSVRPVPDSYLLEVEMRWSNARDAKTIVEELVKLHLEQQQKVANDRRDQLTKNLDRTKNRYELTLQQKGESIAALQGKLAEQGGWGPGGFSTAQIELNATLENQFKLAAELSEAKSEFEAITAQIAAGQTPPEVERAVDNDSQVVRLTSQVNDFELQRSVELAGGAGPEARNILKIGNYIQEVQKSVDERRDVLKNKYTTQLLKIAEIKSQRVQTDFDETKKRVDGLRKDHSLLAAANARLRLDQEDERWWRDQLQHIQNKLTDVNSAAEASLQARINWAPGGMPEVPEIPTFPRLPVTMFVAVLAGLALSLGIAFLREALDDTVRSPRDISRVGQLNVLGYVADENDDPQVADAKLPIFDAPHSATAEQFRQVRTRLQHAASLDTMRSIMVTGPSPQDGKTTIASNLAAGLALNGRRILLVDANFRRPEIHRLFGVANDKGFSDVLNGSANFEDVVRETRVPNLSVLASGPKPMNAAELFESQLLTDFIDRAAEDYDHVIFDSAPFLVVAEPGAMAAKVDGVVTVIRAHAESRGLLLRLRDQLRQVKAEHIGVVLNAVRSQGGGYYGRNIKTYYQYQAEA